MASIITTDDNVLVLDGEIDLHESPRVRQALDALVERRTDALLIDLSGVSYIDSSGIATFIEALQRTHEYGGKLRLFGVRDNVRRIFEIARLDQVFTLFPDKETALKKG